MVRAGVVRHPAEWVHGGYREIQNPRERYALIDLPEVSALCGFAKVDDFQRAHCACVLHEPQEAYMGLLGTENSDLRLGNGAFWADIPVNI